MTARPNKTTKMTATVMGQGSAHSFVQRSLLKEFQSAVSRHRLLQVVLLALMILGCVGVIVVSSLEMQTTLDVQTKQFNAIARQFSAIAALLISMHDEWNALHSTFTNMTAQVSSAPLVRIAMSRLSMLSTNPNDALAPASSNSTTSNVALYIAQVLQLLLPLAAAALNASARLAFANELIRVLPKLATCRSRIECVVA